MKKNFVSINTFYIFAETKQRRMQNEDLTKALKGKTISSVDRVDADEGMIIHFTNGEKLVVVYSSEWGETTLNNKPVDVIGIPLS